MESYRRARPTHSLRPVGQPADFRGVVGQRPRSVCSRRGVQRRLLLCPPTGGGITCRCTPTLGASVLSPTGASALSSVESPPCRQLGRVSGPLFYRLRPGATQALDRLAALRTGGFALRPSPVAPPVGQSVGASSRVAGRVAPSTSALRRSGPASRSAGRGSQSYSSSRAWPCGRGR